MSRDCTEESFLKDISAHQMQVIRDDGVYRHSRFKRPQSNTFYFDLVTWPGVLAVTGDMGSYMFTRMEDMFQFFRTEPCEGKDGLYINLQYWSEKLVAIDGNRSGGKVKEFSENTFKQNIREYFEQSFYESFEAEKDTELDDDGAKRWLAKEIEKRNEIWQEIENDVFGRLEYGKEAAELAAYEFGHKGFHFNDFYEYDNTEYTYHFIWICYAIAWGVKTYDAFKKA